MQAAVFVWDRAKGATNRDRGNHTASSRSLQGPTSTSASASTANPAAAPSSVERSLLRTVNSFKAVRKLLRAPRSPQFIFLWQRFLPEPPGGAAVRFGYARGLQTPT